MMREIITGPFLVGTFWIALVMKGLCYGFRSWGEAYQRICDEWKLVWSGHLLKNVFKTLWKWRIVSFTFHCINGCTSLNFSFNRIYGQTWETDMSLCFSFHILHRQFNQGSTITKGIIVGSAQEIPKTQKKPTWMEIPA